jgi:hypothetical protein
LIAQTPPPLKSSLKGAYRCCRQVFVCLFFFRWLMRWCWTWRERHAGSQRDSATRARHASMSKTLVAKASHTSSLRPHTLVA